MNLIEEWEKGHNIFLTGGAGCGKTYQTNILKEYLDDKGLISFITTTTGAASLQYESAITIHRYSGIGINHKIDQIDKVVNTKRFRDTIQPTIYETEALIIDEVSMLRSDVLDLLNSVFKFAKESDKPFGGIQTMFVADFLQLPPVVKRGEDLEKPWAFQSATWNDLNLKTINLTEVHRQENLEFINVLQNIRIGRCNEWVENYLKKTSTNKLELKPVKLVATNRETDIINERELQKIDSDLEVFNGTTDGDENKVEKLLKDSPAPKTLKLKPGASVIILKNSEDYVNGSMGKYLYDKKIEIFDKETKEVRLVDALFIELTNGEKVSVPLHEYTLKKEVLEEYFDEETNEIKKGKFEIVEASFTQFPVRLGYAITTHRSQGMSLDSVEIDFTRFFAPGQAYVALSRARSYEGLRCLNFSRHAVRVDQNAFNFYMGLKEKGEI